MDKGPEAKQGKYEVVELGVSSRIAEHFKRHFVPEVRRARDAGAREAEHIPNTFAGLTDVRDLIVTQADEAIPSVVIGTSARSGNTSEPIPVCFSARGTIKLSTPARARKSSMSRAIAS